MKTPVVTPVQLVAALTAIPGWLHAIGLVRLRDDQREALGDVQRWSIALVLADAVIRAGRAVGFGRHLDSYSATSRSAVPEPVLGDDDAPDEIGDVTLDDETGVPIVDGDPPLVPAQ